MLHISSPIGQSLSNEELRFLESITRFHQSGCPIDYNVVDIILDDKHDETEKVTYYADDLEKEKAYWERRIKQLENVQLLNDNEINNMEGVLPPNFWGDSVDQTKYDPTTIQNAIEQATLRILEINSLLDKIFKRGDNFISCLVTYSRLGQYEHLKGQRPVVRLFMTTINRCAHGDEEVKKYYIATTFIHEMMHAYLDTGDSHEKYIEEPIAENGMLTLCYYLYQNRIIPKRMYEFAMDNVQRKRFCPPICFYGFGSVLAQLRMISGIYILNSYRKNKAYIPYTSSAYLRYRSLMTYKYEFDKEGEILLSLITVLNIAHNMNLSSD